MGWGMKGITWILTSKGARHNHSWWCFPAQSMRALPCSQAHAGLALPAGHLRPLKMQALHEGAKSLRISAIPAFSLVRYSCLMGLKYTGSCRLHSCACDDTFSPLQASVCPVR